MTPEREADIDRVREELERLEREDEVEPETEREPEEAEEQADDA
jgi:hypothetical protein